MDPKLDLKAILKAHAAWLADEPGGARADLSGADLSRAYLSCAYLYGANLSDAYLYGANLSCANLSCANLSCANLYRAYLSRADLSRAYLSCANLSDANLSDANLSDADLYGANLSDAYLYGAKNADLALAMTSYLPEGDLIAWKKCKAGVIVKLRIPEAAKRSHGATRKCRAEYADVLEVFGAETGISLHDGKTEYRPGTRVHADGWTEDRWETCGQGIHFYITRAEAEAH